MLRRLAARRMMGAALGAGLTLSAVGAQAATFTKANNNTALNLAGSYVANSGTPTSADTVQIDNTVTTAQTFSSGSGLFVGAFKIIDPGGTQTLTINSGGSGTTLTLGAATGGTEIDMSAATADFSILNSGALIGTLRLASGTTTRTFNVATGRTLTIGTSIALQGSTQTLALIGGGNIILNGVVSNGSGVLGLNINGANVSLNNANTYTNGTTLTSGSLKFGNANAAQSSALTDNVASGLTFASGIGSFTVSSLAGSGDITLADTAAAAVTLVSGANNTSTTYSGILSGAGGLTKFGTGTLTLSGANTNSGITTVGGGTLSLTNSNVNTSAVVNSFGILSLGTGGSLGGTILLNGTSANTATLNMAGSGTNFPGNAITLGTGATGTLTSANLSNAIAGTVSSTGTDVTSVLQIGVNISFSGGGGAQQFANFYGTAEIINGGTLRFSNSATPNGNGGSNTTFQIDSGGSLYTRNAGSIILGALSGAGSLTGAGTVFGASTYTVGGNNASTTFSGIISNGGGSGDTTAITKVGTGTLTLSGANTYTGATIISAGTLKAGSTTALGSGSALTINGGTLDFNNISGGLTVGSLSDGGVTTGTLTESGAAYRSLTVNGSATTTYGGLISGHTGITTAGTTNLTLTNTNTNDLGTSVGAGTTLTTTNAQGLGDYAAVNAGSVTGTLQLLNNGTGSNGTITFGGPTNGAYSFQLNGGALVLGNSGANTNNTVQLGTLDIQSTGTTTITGNNSYKLSIAALNSTAGTGASGTISSNTGLTIGSITYGIPTGNSRTLTFSGAGNTTVTGNVGTTGEGGTNGVFNILQNNAASTLTLNGTGSFLGGVSLTAGTVAAGTNTSFGSGTVTFGAGTLTTLGSSAYSFANTVSIAGNGSIGGTNAITFGGALNNTGNNTLTVTNPSTTFNGGGSLANSANNRTLTFAGNGNVTLNGIFINGFAGSNSGITNAGTGLLTLSGANTFSNPVTINAGAGLAIAGDSMGTSGTVASGPVGTGILTLNGGATAGAGASIQASGAAHTIANAVSLGVANINLPYSQIIGSQNLTLSGAVTNTSNNNETITVSNLGLTTFSGGLALTNNNTSRTVTFNGAGNVNISGAVTNGGTATASGLAYAGTGSLTLSGANTYAGATSVTGGLLLVTGSTAAGSAVTVTGTGILGGSGTVSGTVAVNSSGAIAPGVTGPGTLNTGATNYGTAGKYQFDINNAAGAAGTGYDFNNITGGLTIGATSANPFTIDMRGLTAANSPGVVPNFNNMAYNQYTLATASSGISGFGSSAFNVTTTNFTNNNSLGSGAFSVQQSGNNLVLVFNPAAGGTGANGLVQGLGVFASDNASQTAYTGGNLNGQNGGFGYGAFTATNIGGFAGSFIGDAKNNAGGNSGNFINTTGSKSFGFYANTSNTSDGTRAFTGGLTTGRIFAFDFDNGYANGSTSQGFTLKNGSGGTAFEFYYGASDGKYHITDATGQTLTLPFTGNGLHTEFTQTGKNTYTFTVTGPGITTQTFTGTLANSSTGVAAFRPFIYNSQSSDTSSDFNAFFNSPIVSLPTFNGQAGANGNFSTASNFAGHAPVNGGSLAFDGGTGAVTANNDSLTSIYNLAFNAAGTAATGNTTTNATLYTLTGNALTINGGIDNNSTSLQTINNNLTLGANQSFNATNGALTANGSLALNGSYLTVNAANEVAINGNITGNGDILKSGASTLTLSGANTFTGAGTSGSTYGQVFITNGTVRAASNSALGVQASGVSVDLGDSNLGQTGVTNYANNVSLLANPGITLANQLYIANNTVGGGNATRTIGSDGTSGTTTFTGNILLAGNGILTAATGGSVTFTGTIGTPSFTTGGITKTGIGTVTLTGTNGYTGGTTVSAGALSGTTASFGTGAITDNATLDVTQSTSGTLSNTITGSGNLTVGNASSTSAGAIVTLAGANSYTGATVVNGGTLSGDTVNYGAGTVTVNSGGTADYTLANDRTYTPNIGGAGFVTIHALGHTMTYSGVDSAAAGTAISGGVLLLNNATGAALTGPATVASGAAIGLGTNNQIQQASTIKLTLGGGMLAANGHNDATIVDGTHATPVLGQLQVGNPTGAATTSTLDFGDAAGTANGSAGVILAFADSSALTWNGTLVLANANGVNDQLYIGTSADLSPGQLSSITFGVGGPTAQQLSTGQIVFAPEPSGWASMVVGMGALGGIVARKRRKARAV